MSLNGQSETALAAAVFVNTIADVMDHRLGFEYVGSYAKLGLFLSHGRD